MDKFIRRLGTSLGLALLAFGLFGAPAAQAGIADTKHNLGTSGKATNNNKYDGTGEICVFCHTPHGSDTNASVPLWNRALGTPGSYTTYNSLGTSSLDGATAPVGSVSLACLSCHDGTQAMNVMLNTPGSGTAALTGSWGTSSNIGLATDGKEGAIKGGITMIGKDLKNDHPVGIQYAGGPKTAGAFGGTGTDKYTSSLFRDADFKPASSATINNQQVWWVDTSVGTSGAREKTDMQLYTRTDTGTGDLAGTQPFVECASCHDPHSSTNATFLRVSNDGSGVCLSCHIK
ncbi:MAG TPA: cytochrome c3 family protein [Telluria sp.]|nr:cytochrome c3 family protein [Telluria sp.]